MASSNSNPEATASGGESYAFQAEVGRLLDIVANALYSEKEVFLRELISNASDASEKHRYLCLTNPELAQDSSDYAITLVPNKAAKTLTIIDHGIGMNKAELIENLGTIAHSGTGKFMQATKADATKTEGSKATIENLIGQFGVGFYAAFMVANSVEVISQKAGDSVAHGWRSDGKGSFTIEGATRPEGRGTTITLQLRDSDLDYLESYRLESIVDRYSSHIALPIMLLAEEVPDAQDESRHASAGNDDSDDKNDAATTSITAAQPRRLNNRPALWTRPRSEISDQELKDYYRSLSHGIDEARATIHLRAEGNLEYSALLFVPGARPFDLFYPDRKHGVKLFVRRIFITDDCSEILPNYLRFMRGVVDSSDLPLNISRELLQNNPLLPKIRRGLTKKILSELEKLSEDKTAYAAFWKDFGSVLKEGLYEDFENRETLLKLARFQSSNSAPSGGAGASGELISLKDYLSRMKPSQDYIYTLSGESPESLARNPHLEGFRAKSVEVLYLTDPIDEFWQQSVNNYEGKDFRSITRSGHDLTKIDASTNDTGANDTSKEASEKSADPTKTDSDSALVQATQLAALFKVILINEVKDVRLSDRLTESAVCLVADDGDLDLNFEKLLKQHQKLEKTSKRVLEINPHHAVIRGFASDANAADASTKLQDAAYLLLDQARIVEGETLNDPASFARRLERLMTPRANSLDGLKFASDAL